MTQTELSGLSRRSRSISRRGRFAVDVIDRNLYAFLAKASRDGRPYATPATSDNGRFSCKSAHHVSLLVLLIRLFYARSGT